MAWDRLFRNLSQNQAAKVSLLLWVFVIWIQGAAAENGQFAFVTNASTAPVQAEYDYIIIGGGTAGCPLAATLSQEFSVLVVERGGAPFDHPAVQNSVNFVSVLTDVNDDANSAAQDFQSEDHLLFRRARILGGGSAINAGSYSRAEPSWIADRAFDMARVISSYEWVEKVVAQVPQLGPWQTAVQQALLEVGIRPFQNFTIDHMDGTKTGGTIFDSIGHRYTAADLLQYADPHNIQVLIYATVHRITFSSDKTSDGSQSRATGIEFSDELGQQHQASLNSKSGSEIILSAGALGSPQLLLLSGIGPAAHLREFNIPIVLDQPEIGQSMADNPTVSMLVPSTQPLEESLIFVAGILHSGFIIEAMSGVTSSFRHSGTLNTLDPDYRSQETVDNFTRLITTFAKEPLTVLEQAGLLLGKVGKPLSRGYLKLYSTNVRENPLVRFNYFSETQDLYSCIEGVRVMQELVRSKSMSQIVYSEVPDAALTWAGYVGPLAPETNDPGLLSQWCRDTVMTLWQFHGGCQEEVVVDNTYRVFGVDALRIIDGSTFSSSPGTNPQATLMMLGRYMGLEILDERTDTKPYQASDPRGPT